MKSTEAIRTLMKNNNVGATALSRMINVSSARVVTDRLAQPNLSIRLFDQMIKPFGYRIVILQEDTPLPKNGMEIDG